MVKLAKMMKRRPVSVVVGMRLTEEVAKREDEAFVDTEGLLDSILLDAEVREMMEI